METSGEKFDAKNIGQLYAKSYSVMKMYGFLPSVSIECCKNKIDQLYASVMPGDNQWKNGWLYGSASKCNQIFFFKFGSVTPGNTSFTTAGHIWAF